MVTTPRNDEERRILALRVLENNRPFENMEANPDFQEWRDKGPLAYAESLREKILAVNREADERWREHVCDWVIAYQAVHLSMKDEIRKEGTKAARAVLAELDAKERV